MDKNEVCPICYESSWSGISAPIRQDPDHPLCPEQDPRINTSMLTFRGFLVEARFQPEEEYSWAWHPFHGAHSERGYSQHSKLFSTHPELQKLHHYKDGNETEQDYNTPRGYARVDRGAKTVNYTRYDQSKYATKGSHDTVDAQEVDKHIRKAHNVPAHFKSVMHDDPKWWHNHQNAEFKKKFDSKN